MSESKTPTPEPVTGAQLRADLEQSRWCATQLEEQRDAYKAEAERLRVEQATVFAALRDALGASPTTLGQATAQAVKAIAERDAAREQLAGRATVTEYGVLAWSKARGEHHVDPCDDYASAVSFLQWTRRKVDAGALLVSRPVAAPGPVGKWRAVSPDDAAVALETAKAVAQ